MTPVAEVEAVTERALAWPTRVRELSVIDAPSYESASELLKGIKALREEVNATFDPIIAANFKAHRTSCDQKKKAEAPLVEAELTIKRALIAFDDAQERLRREEQARLEREARQRDEDERLARAAAMEIEGREFGDAALVEEAHELLNQPPAPAIIAPVEKATPKVSGQHFTTTWSAQVTSLFELVKHCAKHPEHLNLLAANQTALNGMARAMKDRLAIPGVVAVPSKNLATRS